VIRGYVGVIAEVAATLEPGAEDITERQEEFEALIERFEATDDPIRRGMATVMLSFLAGLFVGEEEYEAIKDNLDLERWFRLPKSHERRIHGHRHAGIRLVLDGPTLVPALDAHAAHPGPFTVDDLLPYRTAREPPCQTEARNRRTIMRKARSKKNRPLGCNYPLRPSGYHRRSCFGNELGSRATTVQTSIWPSPRGTFLGDHNVQGCPASERSRAHAHRRCLHRQVPGVRRP
jgi:hypothetical protein